MDAPDPVPKSTLFKGYREDTQVKPTTVCCNWIPQHLQVDTIATDGNRSWHSCQFVRLRFFYSKLWSYTIANWCFSSDNILSVTTITQFNSVVCLEHPILLDNSVLWSTADVGSGGRAELILLQGPYTAATPCCSYVNYKHWLQYSKYKLLFNFHWKGWFITMNMHATSRIILF